MKQERIEAYEKIRKDLTEAPFIMPDWNIPFKLYIDACGDGLGAAPHQVQIIDENLKKDRFVISQAKLNQQKPDMVRAKWSAYVWYGNLRNSIIILMEV
ncbi:hypothetical protein O181_073092 [Austropuccinia psidii MF-1]|uniref:Reverse transcriptase/retrotransposon-derived protein RNase H-like domain-containing protein n=1 Tax=Austropuccinia psidii MF-1 TaxID=1389203 RepID=A0A9Q3F8D7_9BASI|nr:hypothetical protein [Austropuccinia psidii MF-1]